MQLKPFMTCGQGMDWSTVQLPGPHGAELRRTVFGHDMTADIDKCQT